MRSLSPTPLNAVFPSQIALELLNARFSGCCMLPNLREIRWNAYKERHAALVLPLTVSPFLTVFNLWLVDTSHAQVVASSLAPAYDSLRSIVISWNDSEIVQEFSTLLLKCNPNQLRDFGVDSPLSWTAFLHASQLPNLRYFVIQADAAIPPSGASLPTTMFPSLRYLDIRGIDTDSTWLQSLKRIYPGNLGGLILEFKHATAVKKTLPVTLAHLRSTALHQTLAELTIDLRGGYCPSFEVDGTTIEPLLSLNQLTTLVISFVCGQGKCGHKISDEDLEKLVKAMPKLRFLALGAKLCSVPTNNPVKDLVAIAKHCKHLKKLTIHTNVEAIINSFSDRGDFLVEDPTFGGPALGGCPLRSIIFNPCPIPNGVQGVKIFASTLLRLFPHLAEATSTCPVSPEWKLVGAFITALRLALVTGESGSFVSRMKFADGDGVADADTEVD